MWKTCDSYAGFYIKCNPSLGYPNKMVNDKKKRTAKPKNKIQHWFKK